MALEGMHIPDGANKQINFRWVDFRINRKVTFNQLEKTALYRRDKFELALKVQQLPFVKFRRGLATRHLPKRGDAYNMGQNNIISIDAAIAQEEVLRLQSAIQVDSQPTITPSNGGNPIVEVLRLEGGLPLWLLPTHQA